jgi:hypothetical protein
MFDCKGIAENVNKTANFKKCEFFSSERTLLVTMAPQEKNSNI